MCIQPSGVCIYKNQEHFPFTESCIIKKKKKKTNKQKKTRQVSAGITRVTMGSLQTFWDSVDTPNSFEHICQCLYQFLCRIQFNGVLIFLFYLALEWCPVVPITDNLHALLFHPHVCNMVGWCTDLLHLTILTERKSTLWTSLGPNK